jgi:predicted O-methyltransferase YrrM
MSPEFTRDWITGKTPAWIEHVVPRISPIPGARWIEIGCYQGRSALWTVEHVLRGADSLLYCVDLFDADQPWLDTWGDPSTDYVEIFRSRVGSLPRVIPLVGRSQDVLPILRETRFHGAYIDGDHRERIVRRDVELLWPLLLPGAVCVFDDYGWEKDPGVRIVVDELLADPSMRARLLFADFQAIVLKEG